jgi:GDP-L-fucose synthase
MKKNSCIVVTGANGLAGSAVVKHFRERQYTCVVPITRDDVDLRDPDGTDVLFQRVSPQYVFHAAATVYGIGGNMRNQAKSIYDNTLINTNVVHSCRNVAKIVAMGTNAAYPDPPFLPYEEERIYNGRPHAAEFGYGHAKRHMLAMLECYRESHGLDFTYLVSGNLFGPRDRFDVETGHVLPSLIAKFWQASRDRLCPVEVWGDGRASRDFLYSADLARIVERVMCGDDPYTDAKGETSGAINVGSGQMRSISYVVKKLCSITGVSFDRVAWRTDLPNGRPDTRAQLDKLSLLGFSPAWSFDRALTETWEWYCENRAAGTSGRS